VVDGVEADLGFRVEVHQLGAQPSRSNVVATVVFFVTE